MTQQSKAIEIIETLLSVMRYEEWTHKGTQHDRFLISTTFEEDEWLKYRKACEDARSILEAHND